VTQEYKAAPEQWAQQETWLDQNDADAACLLELRSRVKALEEVENDRRFEQAKALIDKPAPPPAGSLVDRVAGTLHAATNSDPNVPANEWIPEARAAIREVAAWLRLESQSPMTADVLEQEADRG
jgi:hypothetical protein